MTDKPILIKLLHMVQSHRRLLLICVDALLLPFAVWLSFWLRLAAPFHSSFKSAAWWMLPSILIFGLLLYGLSGQYKGLTRYVGSRALYQLALRNCVLILLLVTFASLLGLDMPPRSSWLLLWLLLTVFTGAVRFALRDLLLTLQFNRKNIYTRVAIYGAGAAGGQLSAALRLTNKHSIVLFLDDDSSLWKRSINGVPIQPPQILQKHATQLDQVLIAIPSLKRRRLRQILDNIQDYGIPVLQIPSVEDITSGNARIDSLRPIQVEELLGRDPVPPDPDLLGPGIEGACVCVTGAGGSIGSELCRQILLLNPRRLMLLERSEPSLYTIHQELKALAADKLDLIPVLGDATEKSFLRYHFLQKEIDVVFHAAAYKHVPLVEANPLAGIANNVISTRSVCEAAQICNAKQVVLISTDKAVRPTNVMGASKRLAELVVQAQPRNSTRFTMVRFGNVLGSSGSVVPLFRRQIASGGPITITHPEIIRYFMTIPEAAQLVLQAAVLAKGGDVLLLDMGEPVRIKALAEQMIKLSGLSLKEINNPNGDIDIIYTGLRPGEKLYEELLIDAESKPTDHPLIFRAEESFLDPGLLWPQLNDLEIAIENQDIDTTLSILAKLVPEWRNNGDS